MRNNLPQDVQDFIDSIKDVPFFKIQCRPKPEWKLFIGSSWDAARDAAYTAAYNAAYNAAYKAAYKAAYNAARDAVYNAACNAAHNAACNAAHNAAYDAAYNAVYNAVYNAAHNAVYDAAHNAVYDAALVAICLLTKDKIDPKHLKYAESCWEAWKMGYGVVADVDGVLYVYAKMNGIQRAQDKVK